MPENQSSAQATAENASKRGIRFNLHRSGSKIVPEHFFNRPSPLSFTMIAGRDQFHLYAGDVPNLPEYTSTGLVEFSLTANDSAISAIQAMSIVVDMFKK